MPHHVKSASSEGRALIDMDMVHFIFQFPVVIVEYMAAALMLMRWRWAQNNRGIDIDPAVTLLLAAFIGAIATKQAFWTLQGAIRAADLHDVASHFGHGHWLPILGNASILVTGTALMSRVGSVFMGPASYAVAVASLATMLGVGAAITRWG